MLPYAMPLSTHSTVTSTVSQCHNDIAIQHGHCRARETIETSLGVYRGGVYRLSAILAMACVCILVHRAMAVYNGSAIVIDTAWSVAWFVLSSVS